MVVLNCYSFKLFFTLKFFLNLYKDVPKVQYVYDIRAEINKNLLTERTVTCKLFTNNSLVE